MEEEMLKILFPISYGTEITEEEKGISFFEIKKGWKMKRQYIITFDKIYINAKTMAEAENYVKENYNIPILWIEEDEIYRKHNNIRKE